MKTRWIIAAATLASGFTVVHVYASIFKGYSTVQTATCFLAPSPTELTEVGQPIANALEAYHAEHAVYPMSLSDLDIAIPTTFYGDWRYSIYDDQNSCLLVVGDYGRYLFEVSWDPGHGWYVDT